MGAQTAAEGDGGAAEVGIGVLPACGRALIDHCLFVNVVFGVGEMRGGNAERACLENPGMVSLSYQTT